MIKNEYFPFFDPPYLGEKCCSYVLLVITDNLTENWNDYSFPFMWLSESIAEWKIHFYNKNEVFWRSTQEAEGGALEMR